MKPLFAILLTALTAAADGLPKLIFTKSFPGSVPPYVSVSLDGTGVFQYSEALNDDKPLQAKMKQSDAAELFGLAQKLGYFKAPIESGLKVANTGKKTFRYLDENGAKSEVTFNYSTDVTAKALLDRFEQIAESERAYLDLDRTMRFDKLGVNDSLAEIESLYLRKELTAPEQFLPLFTRITAHQSFMHIVRDRAARLNDEFQSGPPSTAEKK